MVFTKQEQIAKNQGKTRFIYND